MTNDTYHTGELITVTFTDAVVIHADSNTLHIQTANDEVIISFDDSDCRISRSLPADGEPKPGEIWTDTHGQIWFARSRPDRKDSCDLIGADGHTQHPARTSLNWIDIHREAGPIRRVWTPPKTEP